ncbi:LysR family transcriptional regulator [Trinickia caryophylli]|uniref:Transcriptional regulator, LysR family n=1 Tax=Trinickia caryophylli TaxID=28094 RepID=A0A1X7E2Z3_TRICW|nr:LysR family transcriptional regulator [Trinickia caryophylli]PMS14012.1 LysR family transcriptional regulator [Trinickia caryophylli]TRX17704.1 LysR family transcriptional regulator [Trinickia caryophylli]WQE11536.1 LysR family transcriptional regulator [Trinickia caryophylli]SMF26297.1 transcriptional regulator, LysR family [Trinickia caryophylli]GLU32704.1 LysR family transcriptional regulator [Trinickia caryophylli]
MNFVRSLTLRQLQIFIVASRHASFARAAEELHLTQPAISMQIRQLEDAIGMPLFERVARKLTLTEAGERLTHHASRILGEIKDAEDAMMSLQLADSGSIAVGIVSSATYFAPKLLALYSRQYPKVDVHFSVGNRESLLRLLQDNAIDLALMGRPPAELDTTVEPLAYHPQVVIAPSDHPLVGASRFDLQELRGDTFLLREPGSGTRMAAEEMFRQHLFTPAKIVTLGSNETIKQAVIAGMGVSLISLHTLQLELRTSELAILDVNGTPIERTWQVVHMRTKQLSPTCTLFRRFLLEHTAPYLEREYGGYVPHKLRPRVEEA